jgi:hypothetical protein
VVSHVFHARQGGKYLEIPKLDPKLKVPIIVGVLVFVSEFIFGWLSFILIVIPMILVLGFIVGYLAGGVEESVVSLVITLIVGNIIGAAIVAMVLFPSWLGPGRIDLEALAIIFFITPFYASTGASTLLNGFAMNEAFLITFLSAPGLYFFSFGFAAIGGKLNERMHTGNVGYNESEASTESEQEVVLEVNSTN